MDNNQHLLKFKVYDLETQRFITRHTKLKYARKSRKYLIDKHNFKPSNLIVVYLAYPKNQGKYISMARIHRSIFGY